MEVEDLKKQILAANKAYRDGHPTMDDQVFDDLCEKLEKIIPTNEYAVFRDSLHEAKGKVKHPFVMGSLDKLKAEEPENVKKFIKEHITTCLNVSAKVDGISSRAHYENGKLVSLASRGDGEFGENLTAKMSCIKHLPKTISILDPIDIRGELVICKDDFARMEGFANARNACAGIMNRKDWREEDVSNVSFVAYAILGPRYIKSEQFDILEANGFTTAWNTDYASQWYSKDTFIEQLFNDASQDFAYDTDGLVICDSTYKNEDKYRPDAQVAFKINQLTATTRLIDVVWEGPSKDGLFIPVGILDPIELGGSCISRVSLHNLDIIEKLGVKYGSTVRILKSGDIIPKIVEVLDSREDREDLTPIEIPTECSCCGSKLVRDGVNMRCMNTECSEQVVHRLVNFIKKLGVKSALNSTLMNFGLTSFDKLLAFEPDKNYKSQVKLYDELYAKVLSQSKEKLLGAMNFVGLSETLINKIVDHYGIDAIESDSFIAEAKAHPLPSGIGQATLDSFIEGRQEALANMNKVINDVRWHWSGGLENGSRNVVETKGSICVTGSLKFGSRNKFLEFAKEHGYESKSGVSKGLTYLINNDVSSGSSKNRKAKELGIKILSEDEFIKLINEDELEPSNIFDI